MKVSKTANIIFTAIAILAAIGASILVIYSIYCLLTMKGVMIHQ